MFIRDFWWANLTKHFAFFEKEPSVPPTPLVDEVGHVAVAKVVLLVVVGDDERLLTAVGHRRIVVDRRVGGGDGGGDGGDGRGRLRQQRGRTGLDGGLTLGHSGHGRGRQWHKGQRTGRPAGCTGRQQLLRHALHVGHCVITFLSLSEFSTFLFSEIINCELIILVNCKNNNVSRVSHQA